MPKKIAFLINPHKRTQLQAYVTWVRSRVDFSLVVYDEKWPESLDGFDEVWVMGGDGTFNYFVNRYPDCSIPIALFKGGTGNDFYWKLYGKISKEMHLNAVLAGHSESFDAGQVNSMLFLNGVGIGIEGEVLAAMDAIRWIGGALGYYLAAIPALFRFKTYEIQGSKPVFLCMVFNSARAGGGFLFFPSADVQDGELDMLTCDPLPVWKRLFYMPIIQSGGHVNLPFIRFSKIKSERIVCNRVLRAQVDGEVLASDTFEFKILPAKFKFIVPTKHQTND
jgi:diacylglycerol kinase family enzyme